MTSTTTAPAQPVRATAKEWAGLALLVLPMIMVASDLTVLFLALPTLGADLQPGPSEELWIVHIYGFIIAGLLITAGRLGDRVGPRKLLLIGATAFSNLAVVAAFSVSPAMLIIARALLGAAGATLMPSLFSLLRTMFRDEAQRRVAIAVILSSFSVGGAIGPLLGGALLEFFWWGSVFLVNVPFMVVLVILGPVLLPERTERNRTPLDPVSVLLSLAGMLAVVYGLQEFAATTSWANLGITAVGLGVLALFLRRQARLDAPLLDLELFRNRQIVVALGTVLIVGIAMVGVFFLITQFLQSIVGLTPLEAGIWTLPYIALNIAGAMIAPALTRKFRPVTVVCGGLVTATIGALLIALVASPTVGATALITAVSVMAFGPGVAFALIMDLIVSSAPEDKVGSASSVQEVAGELGTALGTAASGAVAVAVGTGVQDGVSQGIQVYAIAGVVLIGVMTALNLSLVRRSAAVPG